MFQSEVDSDAPMIRGEGLSALHLLQSYQSKLVSQHTLAVIAPHVDSVKPASGFPLARPLQITVPCQVPSISQLWSAAQVLPYILESKMK